MSNCARPRQTSEIEQGDHVIFQADGISCLLLAGRSHGCQRARWFRIRTVRQK